MTQEYQRPPQSERRGFTPLELLRDENFYFSQPLTGAGRLTFPPDPRFPKPDGTPRRLEWLSNPAHIATLTGHQYNKPGKPTLIEVAQDLLAAQQRTELAGQVLAVTDPAYLARIENLERRLVQAEEKIQNAERLLTPQPDMTVIDAPKPKANSKTSKK